MSAGLRTSTYLAVRQAKARVKETCARISEKLHAAGKRIFGELAESFSVFDMTKDANAELLQKHGRRTKLGW